MKPFFVPFHKSSLIRPQVAEAIDAVSVADVKTVAAKVLSSTPSMGAKGGLECVPYVDEL